MFLPLVPHVKPGPLRPIHSPFPLPLFYAMTPVPTHLLPLLLFFLPICTFSPLAYVVQDSFSPTLGNVDHAASLLNLNVVHLHDTPADPNPFSSSLAT